jgi:hypothetical protein
MKESDHLYQLHALKKKIYIKKNQILNISFKKRKRKRFCTPKKEKISKKFILFLKATMGKFAKNNNHLLIKCVTYMWKWVNYL